MIKWLSLEANISNDTIIGGKADCQTSSPRGSSDPIIIWILRVRLPRLSTSSDQYQSFLAILDEVEFFPPGENDVTIRPRSSEPIYLAH